MLNIAFSTTQLNKPTLCKQYWNKVYSTISTNNEVKDKVTYHAGLVTLNKYLNGLKSYIKRGSQKMPMNHAFKGTVDELIRKTDTEFKLLKPTEGKTVLTRGLNQVQNTESAEYKLLQQHKQLKKGDKLTMKGYAYAAPKESGNPYTENPNVALIYDFEIPKKARLSQLNGEYIFPRCSNFEVVDNIDLGNNITNLKLKYILPD